MDDGGELLRCELREGEELWLGRVRTRDCAAVGKRQTDALREAKLRVREKQECAEDGVDVVVSPSSFCCSSLATLEVVLGGGGCGLMAGRGISMREFRRTV